MAWYGKVQSSISQAKCVLRVSWPFMESSPSKVRIYPLCSFPLFCYAYSSFVLPCPDPWDLQKSSTPMRWISHHMIWELFARYISMLSSHFALFIPCIQPAEYFLFLCTFARLLACCLDFTPILQTIASYPSLSLLSFSKKFFPVPLHGTHATHSSNPTIGIGYHICQLAACSWTTGPPHGYQSSSTHFCYFYSPSRMRATLHTISMPIPPLLSI